MGTPIWDPALFGVGEHGSVASVMAVGFRNSLWTLFIRRLHFMDPWYSMLLTIQTKDAPVSNNQISGRPTERVT